MLNGSQQQWLTRNSTLGSWSNGVWNQVSAGVEGAPDDASFPAPPYTTVETTPLSREKPYLFVDDEGRYRVPVPYAATDSSGITWDDGVYVFNQNNPENGFEVPETPGVRLHHIMTVNLSAGTIDHVVNGVGGPADTSNIGAPVYILDYP